ncbi:hypothetical protein Hanom_Chr03g00198991 [Helianthus anomalus]
MKSRLLNIVTTSVMKSLAIYFVPLRCFRHRLGCDTSYVTPRFPVGPDDGFKCDD